MISVFVQAEVREQRRLGFSEKIVQLFFTAVAFASDKPLTFHNCLEWRRSILPAVAENSEKIKLQVEERLGAADTTWNIHGS